ncbi:MAG: nitrilase-related carbon-nitrogen hydrolase [Ardenticatenales bacterium]
MNVGSIVVAGVEMDIAWEDPAENLERADAAAAAARSAGATLLVLPEMFATGFSMAAEHIAPWGGEIRMGMAEIARRHNLWVIGGYAEPGPGRPRNAASVIDPRGDEALRYHKIHPFSFGGEDAHYDGGDALPGTVDIDGVRVTPLICYDLRFPEPFRAAADRTDLFVVIANWPAARAVHWSALLAARAIENQAYVLGVNRVGEGGGLAYQGGSVLLDPWGLPTSLDSPTLATTTDHARLIYGQVAADTVADARKRFSALADRRPDVYRRLAEPTA